MAKLPWWQTGVVYQVYPRSFKDSDGDGIGDLKGVVEKLDYLSGTLGVSAVWISPFYPSPMRDFGYDISDFTDVDPTFGTLEDFDRLMQEAHKRRVRVLLDYVPSHTSDEHPWFLASRASRTNPKRDWYVWRDAKPGGSPPNNWVEETGGSVWEWDGVTEQYYLHSHYASQPDLNWRNPEVREAMFEVLRFWLNRGVDGFRVDVAHMIMKDPQLRDNPLNPNPRSNPYDRQHPDFHSQLHVHDRQHPDLHGVYGEMRKLLGSYGDDKLLIGEIDTAPWETWILYYGKEFNEFQMPFNFQLIETPWTAEAVRAFVDAFEAALPNGAWPNYVLGNHDRPRLASRYGVAQARVAAMLLLTLRGTPTLYQGDELGMRDTDVPLEKINDLLGRDPTRTPMQWDASLNAGFCPEDVEPWLPVTQDFSETNVAVEQDDPRSLLNLYRHLLAIRKATPALNRGTYRVLDPQAADCYVYLREHGEKRLLVVLNLSDRERRVYLPDLPAGKVLLSTFLDRHTDFDPTKLVLRGDEGVIVELCGADAA